MEEQTDLTLQAIVEPASRTVRWVNRERQNPALPLAEFVRSKGEEGWTIMGITPSGGHLLLILKRPAPQTPAPD
jgi:hypothetical protein